MDLFAVVKLEKPKQVTVGVRPLRENEQPLFDVTAGHLTVLGQAAPEDSPPLLVTPVQSVPPTGEPAHVEKMQNPKRKGETGGSGTSKRRRHLIADEESSAEDDTCAIGADKEIAKASPFL